MRLSYSLRRAGRRSRWELRVPLRSCRLLCLVVVLALLAPAGPTQSDQPQYFHDELGRLVGAVDGQGNVTVYTYDEVGNLLPLQRFTSTGGGSSGAIGIFLVTPTSGRVGATVQIQGFGFDPTTSNNQVKFNGTSATVIAATVNAITTTVPTGATTGPITVTNTNGTATSAKSFTVLVPPIITGIDPTKVPQGITTRANIAGFNLADATAVTFAQAGLAASIVSGATSQNLPVNIFANTSVPPGSYPFSVTTPGGTTQSGTIMVTVAAAKPTFGVSKPVSVFMPVITTVPATSGPGAGTHESVAPPTSVSMP